jgi:hypothetical protein
MKKNHFIGIAAGLLAISLVLTGCEGEADIIVDPPPPDPPDPVIVAAEELADLLGEGATVSGKIVTITGEYELPDDFAGDSVSVPAGVTLVLASDFDSQSKLTVVVKGMLNIKEDAAFNSKYWTISTTDAGTVTWGELTGLTITKATTTSKIETAVPLLSTALEALDTPPTVTIYRPNPGATSGDEPGVPLAGSFSGITGVVFSKDVTLNVDKDDFNGIVKLTLKKDTLDVVARNGQAATDSSLSEDATFKDVYLKSGNVVSAKIAAFEVAVTITT